jgi:hypothetical protein
MDPEISRQAGEIYARLPYEDRFVQPRDAKLNGVCKAQGADRQWNAMASLGGMTAFVSLFFAVQVGGKMIGEQLLANALNNADAAFSAAHKIANAQSFAEAAGVQVAFAQLNLTFAHEQSQRLFALAGQIAKETASALVGVAPDEVEDLMLRAP